MQHWCQDFFILIELSTHGTVYLTLFYLYHQLVILKWNFVRLILIDFWLLYNDFILIFVCFFRYCIVFLCILYVFQQHISGRLTLCCLFETKWNELLSSCRCLSAISTAETLYFIMQICLRSLSIIYFTVLDRFYERSLSSVRLSVCLSNACAPYSGVEIFGHVSTLFGTLAILWHPWGILRRSSQGNPSVCGVKHKRGSQT